VAGTLKRNQGVALARNMSKAVCIADTRITTGNLGRARLGPEETGVGRRTPAPRPVLGLCLRTCPSVPLAGQGIGHNLRRIGLGRHMGLLQVCVVGVLRPKDAVSRTEITSSGRKLPLGWLLVWSPGVWWGMCHSGRGPITPSRNLGASPRTLGKGRVATSVHRCRRWTDRLAGEPAWVSDVSPTSDPGSEFSELENSPR